MRKAILLAALISLAAIGARADMTVGQLSIEVESAIAEIDPRPPGPRLVRLPDLALTMHISAQCSADMRAESATISIADTPHSLGPESLGDAAGTDLTINVPHLQLAPLTIENFCLSGAAVNDSGDLHIADALSAQVSLLCVGENQQSIVYQSVPLGIALHCKSRLDD